MAEDYLTAVACWLVAQPHAHHQLADVVRGLPELGPDRHARAEAVQAVADLLDVTGLCVVYHHGSMAAIAIQHRDGLRRVAAGESLAEVARDVEPARPVTIVRTQAGEYAAWYRTPLRLPVAATTLGLGGALGPTPDAAYTALRAGVTRRIGESLDQTTTGQ